MASERKQRAVAVGYVRVSTEDQAKHGWSLPEQRRRIKAYCEARDWTLRYVYADEGLSGKKGVHRPEFEKMVCDVLADGVRYVVGLKLARLGRNALELLSLFDRLEDKGTNLVLIEDSIDTSTAQGRLLRTVLAGMAEFERDEIADRTRMGVQAAASAGKRVGQPPYGFTVEDGFPALLASEQAVIARIESMHSDGISLAQIAATLNTEGVPARRGRWHPTTVARVLRRGGVE